MGHVGSPLLLHSTDSTLLSLTLSDRSWCWCPGEGSLYYTLMQASKAGCCEIKTAVETAASTATAIKLKGSGSKTLQKMQAAKAKVKGKK